MPVSIVLLRGVNVGGRQLAMSDLKAACLAAGCEEARTLLASGNVVVRAAESGDALARKLEAALVKQCGLKTDFYVRTPKQWSAAIAANPFKGFTQKQPTFMVLYTLKAKPNAAEIKRALEPQGGPEEIAIKGAFAYVTYPNGQGPSKFKVRLEGTARNWNTVKKLQTLAAGMEGA